MYCIETLFDDANPLKEQQAVTANMLAKGRNGLIAPWVVHFSDPPPVSPLDLLPWISNYAFVLASIGVFVILVFGVRYFISHHENTFKKEVCRWL